MRRRKSLDFGTPVAFVGITVNTPSPMIDTLVADEVVVYCDVISLTTSLFLGLQGSPDGTNFGDIYFSNGYPWQVDIGVGIGFFVLPEPIPRFLRAILKPTGAATANLSAILYKGSLPA